MLGGRRSPAFRTFLKIILDGIAQKTVSRPLAIRHQLRLAEPDFDIGANDRVRIGIGEAVEAVGNGADLHSVEFRVDLGGARGPERQSGDLGAK